MFNYRGQKMKRLLLAGVALSVASAASAADLRARPYPKAAAPATVVAAYNWSGFYVGAMGGYAGALTILLLVIRPAAEGLNFLH